MNIGGKKVSLNIISHQEFADMNKNRNMVTVNNPIDQIIDKSNDEIIDGAINDTIEKWKSLSYMGYPNYEISTLGRILNIKRNLFIKGSVKKDGYRRVLLTHGGKSKQFIVHRLLAITFIPKPESDQVLTVDHIDRHRDNNKISNLRWATNSEQSFNQNRSPLTGKTRQIYQYDLSNNLILKWDSATHIENAGFANRTSIHAICRGVGNTCAGFIWKYADTENLEGEIWKCVPYEYFDNFFASNFGRIKRPNGKILTGTLHNGYYAVAVKIPFIDKKISKRVHRLVISSFSGRKDDMVVNHIDGNPQNNNINNLEYVTAKENTQHAVRIGLMKGQTIKRKVISIDINGTEIEHNSITEASKLLNVPYTHISTVCMGKRNHTGGYKFRYADGV